MSYFKKLLTTVCFSILFLGISGCGPMYQTHQTFNPPKSWAGKQCANQCLDKRTTCQMQCRKANEKCRKKATQAALPAYAVYLSNKEQRDAYPGRTQESFADYSACDGSCGCDTTYNLCFSNCGGTVTEHRTCVAFCD